MKKVTCRPCKEQPGKWEIQDSNGNVQKLHYETKEACVRAAQKMANEFSAELVVENQNNSNTNSGY